MPHVLTLAVLALLLAWPVEAQEGPITGRAALEALVSDRTQYGDRADGTRDIEYHHPDGRSAYWYWSCLYRGRWWATEEALCYLYPETDWPGPHCFTVVRNEGQVQLWSADGSDSQPTVVVTQDLPGNTEGFPLDQNGACSEISLR